MGQEAAEARGSGPASDAGAHAVLSPASLRRPIPSGDSNAVITNKSHRRPDRPAVYRHVGGEAYGGRAVVGRDAFHGSAIGGARSSGADARHESSSFNWTSVRRCSQQGKSYNSYWTSWTRKAGPDFHNSDFSVGCGKTAKVADQAICFRRGNGTQ